MHVHISALLAILMKQSVPVEMIERIMDDLILRFCEEEHRKLDTKFNKLRFEINKELANYAK